MTAQKAVDALQAVWLQHEASGNTEEAKQAYAKFKEAKDEVGKAKLEVEKAEAKVEKATGAVKASVQAGREQAGASACATVAVAFGLQPPAWSSCVFVRSNRFCFLGSCSPLGKDSLVVKLHCVGLQHFGERELGCFRFRQIWLLFVFCRPFRTGCQS